MPRQLPVHTPHFVGRAEELRLLTTLLDAATEGRPVVISAINGTAGIGKTALAVHWAHQVAAQFLDGQLYANLRGFDPTGTPMKPAEAIRGFLDAFEVPPERIPVDLDAQAALYRSLLADQKVLVLLDNARDADQVRPLLPGSATCRVVITSRNQLASLITQEGAQPVTLGVLSADEAGALLARHLGQDRVTAELDVVAELIRHCARLPLALAIVAARAALNPLVPLRVLFDELRDEQSRLDALDVGDPATSVRAVFSWSYQHLSSPAARMFRLLGLHPGPDISPPAAASLAGISLRHARETLTELTCAHLVAQNGRGRFSCHDLLRIYATEQARAVDTTTEQHTAIGRMLDFYLHTGYAADRLLDPTRVPISLDGSSHQRVAPLHLTDYDHALAWFEAEHPVLLAILARAAGTGFDTHGWQIPWSLATFLQRRGHWHDWAATQRIAMTAARRRADRLGQAHAHRGLGRANTLLGSYEQAHFHLREALILFEEIGDQVGQAHVHVDLSHVFEHQRHLHDALEHAQQALAMSRTTGNLLGQARALNNLGWFRTLLGDHHDALTPCHNALTLYRKLDDHRGEARTLDSLGHAYHQLGDHQHATACLQHSLALHRQLGDRHSEALVLIHLGDTKHTAGDLQAARDAWQQALDLLDHLGLVRHPRPGFPNADQIRTKLRNLANNENRTKYDADDNP